MWRVLPVAVQVSLHNSKYSTLRMCTSFRCIIASDRGKLHDFGLTLMFSIVWYLLTDVYLTEVLIVHGIVIQFLTSVVKCHHTMYFFFFCCIDVHIHAVTILSAYV